VTIPNSSRRHPLAIHFAGICRQAKLAAMIGHARKPERRMKMQACAGPPIAAVVTTSNPGPCRRARETVAPDAEAAVNAWFAKNIRPPRS